jgi:hypothetical protein
VPAAGFQPALAAILGGRRVMTPRNRSRGSNTANRLKTLLRAVAIPSQSLALVLFVISGGPTAAPEIQAPCTRHGRSATEACRFFENLILAGGLMRLASK